MAKLNVLIAGCNGYIRIELIKLLIKHKRVNIKYLCGSTSVGKKISHFDKSIKGKLPKIIKFNKSKNLINEIDYLFSEDQGRYIIEINPKDLKEVTKILDQNSVYHEELGIIIEKDMIINQKTKVTIDELKSYNSNWLTNFMSA